METRVQFSVFTKPWRDLDPRALGRQVHDWGFDGIELPVRPGFQVEPDTAVQQLPKVAQQLQSAGVQIFSVASELEESIFAACAAAGVPMVRIMAPIRRQRGYLASEAEAIRRIQAAIPWAERYQVRIGVQQHYGDFVSNTVGLLRLMEQIKHPLVQIVWDAAHDALAGFEPEYGLELAKPYLGMVNLKNAYYRRQNGPESDADWERYFTLGSQGQASWSRVAAILQETQYAGVVCLTAEYTDEAQVDRLIQQDIVYAKSLFPVSVPAQPVGEGRR